MNIREVIRSGTTIGLVALAAAAVSGCSGFDGAGNGNLSDAERAQTLDVDLNEVSAEGCMNIASLTQRLRTLPSGSVIREYTRDFQMEDKTDKDTPVRREMEAETAFSNFAFDEKAEVLFAADLPNMTQESCSAVVITDQLSGSERFKITTAEEAASEPNVLRLTREDGQKEMVFKLVGPRELEITTVANRIDRCPDFRKAKATSRRLRTWGTQAEIDQTPLSVSVSYLKKIQVAILEMPTTLKDALYGADSEYIEPSINDLRALRAASLDPKISDCPGNATPPSVDEPPPPESDETPEIGRSPTPVPEPGPTPAPEPAPAPFPIPGV
jgi:hypothetical protein